jgi:hypothetical protein
MSANYGILQGTVMRGDEMKRLVGTVILGILLLPNFGYAEDMGFYVGGGVGQASLAVNGNYFDQEFDDINLSDDAFAWKAWGGLQVLPIVGVEVSYHQFGDIDDANEEVRAALDADTLAIFARGVLPIGPLQLFGKLGYHFYDAEASLSELADDISTTIAEDGQEFAIGAGAGLELGNLTFRAEYELFLFDGIDDLSTLSLGVSYSF